MEVDLVISLSIHIRNEGEFGSLNVHFSHSVLIVAIVGGNEERLVILCKGTFSQSIFIDKKGWIYNSLKFLINRIKFIMIWLIDSRKHFLLSANGHSLSA